MFEIRKLKRQSESSQIISEVLFTSFKETQRISQSSSTGNLRNPKRRCQTLVNYAIISDVIIIFYFMFIAKPRIGLIFSKTRAAKGEIKINFKSRLNLVRSELSPSAGEQPENTSGSYRGLQVSFPSENERLPQTALISSPGNELLLRVEAREIFIVVELKVENAFGVWIYAQRGIFWKSFVEVIQMINCCSDNPMIELSAACSSSDSHVPLQHVSLPLRSDRVNWC